MNLVHKIETWGNTHHPIILDPLRIALGIFLVLKGADFMNHTAEVYSLVASKNAAALPDGVLMTVVYFVAFVHLSGGLLIALGVATRLASLVQIPIVFGGVLLANSVTLPVNNDAWLSIVILVMLILFSIVGSGKLSIDRVLDNQNS